MATSAPRRRVCWRAPLEDGNDASAPSTPASHDARCCWSPSSRRWPWHTVSAPVPPLRRRRPATGRSPLRQLSAPPRRLAAARTALALCQARRVGVRCPHTHRRWVSGVTEDGSRAAARRRRGVGSVPGRVVDSARLHGAPLRPSVCRARLRRHH